MFIVLLISLISRIYSKKIRKITTNKQLQSEMISILNDFVVSNKGSFYGKEFLELIETMGMRPPIYKKQIQQGFFTNEVTKEGWEPEDEKK